MMLHYDSLHHAQGGMCVAIAALLPHIFTFPQLS